MIWRYFGVSSFYFFCVFRTNCKKKHLDENDFRLSQLCSKFSLNNYKQHWQQHLRYTLQLKILRKWINMRANFFLVKYHGTQIDEVSGQLSVAQKTKPLLWRTFHQNDDFDGISFITACFLFSQTNLVFEFNIVLVKQFSPQFIYLLPFDIPCILKFFQCLYALLEEPVIKVNVHFLRFTAAKCSYVFIFHEIFVPVNGKHFSWL